MAYLPDQGDIIWLDLDPTQGREIQKTRPVLVLSKKAFSQMTQLAVVAPITSTVRGNAFEVPLTGGQTEGVVLSQQIRTVDYSRRGARLIERADSDAVQETLAKARAILT